MVELIKSKMKLRADSSSYKVHERVSDGLNEI